MSVTPQPRQIGWRGQSGAHYSMGEDRHKYEPGPFTPVWREDAPEPGDGITVVSLLSHGLYAEAGQLHRDVRASTGDTDGAKSTVDGA